MPKFKNDKVMLLKALHDIVTNDLKQSDISPYDEEEISNLVIDLKDKKRIRYLKSVLRELEILIKKTYTEDKLRRQEKMYNDIQQQV